MNSSRFRGPAGLAASATPSRATSGTVLSATPSAQQSVISPSPLSFNRRLVRQDPFPFPFVWALPLVACPFPLPLADPLSRFGVTPFACPLADPFAAGLDSGLPLR